MSVQEKDENIWQKILTYSLYPIILFVPIFGALWMIEQEVNDLVIVAITSLGTALFIVFMEYIYPEHNQWRPKWKVLKTDLIHLLVTSVFPPMLFKAVLAALFLALAQFISHNVGFDLWPHHWHLFWQMILAIHLGDMGYYILHRGLHEIPAIWPYHAVHHSPEELYVIASNRAHPIQIFFTFGMQMMILWTLGINDEALLMFSVFVAVNGQLQHCNIKMRCGIFNYVFATSDLHRWHHSIVIPESNSNYGNNIVFWDILLGTWFLPKQVTIEHDHIGLPHGTAFPDTYWGQLMVPFDWENVRYDRKENPEAYKKRLEAEKAGHIYHPDYEMSHHK